jgi:hypothetical protein
MSPTSYQTAPPRDLMITTVVGSVKRANVAPRSEIKFQLSQQITSR